MSEDVDFVREAILACDRCELRGQATQPVPFSGPAPAKNGIAVVAEAPGKDEDEQGVPLIGRAGQVLREDMLLVGINPENCTLLNTASCFPGELKTPNETHIKACQGNKLAQLDLAQPQWVLLLGKIALNGFRNDLQLGQARGRPFQMEPDGPVFFTTYHPAAGLRKFDYRKVMRADLARFLEMVKDGNWYAFIGERCAVCADWMYFVDRTGIPWCEEHLPIEGIVWKQQQESPPAATEAEGVQMLLDAFPGSEVQ